MTDIRVELHDAPPAPLLERLEVELVRYNDSVAPREEYRPLGAFAFAGPEMVAGVSGFTHWNWLFVEHLWVQRSHRGAGIGRRLMAKVESRAIERGVAASRVSTYSFQAPAFYEHLGYVPFASLDEYPTGSRLIFLAKQLLGG